MSKTVFISKCLFCDSEFETIDKRKKFCNSSCAAQYNNKRRRLKKSSKLKISKSLTNYFDNNPRFKKPKKEFLWSGIKSSKGKFYKNPQSIWDISKRTRLKILRRLEISCSRCEWNEEICDIHHIIGRKIKDCHNHNNLSYLCPNCHRLAQRGKIKPEHLINLNEQIGDEWKKHYYG